MKRVYAIGLMAVLLCAALLLQAQTPRGADVQMKAAQHKAEVEGDLKGAIEAYQKVVEVAGGNRGLAAQALVRMAECYQKLGDAQARAVYERVVTEYADQKDAAALAQARLRESASPAADVVARQIWKGQHEPIWGPSPDGAYVIFDQFNNLFVREIASGTVRQLTRGGVGPEPGRGPEAPTDVTFSRDGRRVAYGWKRTSGYELRVINFDGTDERTITHNPEHQWIGPADWSPDGARILARVNTPGKVGQIAWVSVTDGAVQVLKTVPWTSLGRIALSPDGRYIAYDQRTEDKPAARTIFVLAADGSKQIAVTDGSSRDEVIGWPPDGGALAFATYRSGSPEVWLLPVKDGAIAGPATLVKRDLGSIQPLGFTKNGSLFYTQIVTTGDAYVASVDWEAGRMTDVRKINTNLTADFGAAWSPDGSQIAYVAHRGTELQRRVIAVYTVSDGSTREVVPAEDLIIQTTGGYHWSPDGTAFLLNATSATQKSATFSVDLRTGRLRTLATFSSGYAQIPQWLNGARSLVYVYRDQFKPTARIVIRDLDSGTEREVRHGFESEPVAGALVSPDEVTLVFVAGSADRPPEVLRRMPLAGGPARVLLDIPGSTVWPVAWTPDSQRLIYSRTDRSRNPAGNPRAAGEPPATTLWVVALNGGESRQLTFPHAVPRSVDVHPDGRQITYIQSENHVEVWAMDRLSSAMARAR